jgi:hypothetical protein
MLVDFKLLFLWETVDAIGMIMNDAMLSKSLSDSFKCSI